MQRLSVFLLACCLLAAGCTAGIAESGGTAVTVQTGTVETNGFTMNYCRFGQGKEVLVILPGLSIGSVLNYAEAVAEAYSLLSDSFTVYLFDRRNELTETYSVNDMAQDTAEAFHVLGLNGVALFGASQGGMMAQVIAGEHPELVSALILGSTAARMDTDRFRLIEEWIRLAKAGNAEELYLAFGEAIYPGEVFEQSREALAAAAQSVTEEDLERFVLLAEGMKDFDVTDLLQDIRCPVLILGSRDDRVLGPDGSEQIAELLKSRPDAELYLYDGFGHAAYDLAPDYKERMLRFLSGTT